MPSTVHFHRIVKAPASRVYKAFTDAAALCKWLPPAGYTCKVLKLDVKIGGTFRMSFTEFDSGSEMFFGGEYLDVVPGQKLRYVDRFEDPNLAGDMEVAVKFRDVTSGTELTITQSGIPDIIPKDACELGWQDSLRQLLQFVEIFPQPIL